MNASDDTLSNSKAAARDVENFLKDGAAEVAATAHVAARDVRKGAAKVLDAASDVAAELRDEVNPGLGSRVSSAARSAADMARVTTERAVDVADTIQDATEDFVRERPWTSLAMAALGGALIATVVQRTLR